MKYFGTDGIRLENMPLLTNLAIKTSYALKKMGAKKIVVGYDGRPYGKKIVKTLIKSLNILGIHTYFVKIVPSACASFLNKENHTDFAIMITASHNASNVNGIKIFNSKGEKLTRYKEKQIETYFTQLPNNFLQEILLNFAKENKIKKAKNHKLSTRKYLNTLKQHTPLLTNKKIVLDCANGASKFVAKKVFKNTRAKIICINRKNGKHINENCGAVHPEMLKNAVIKHKANLGFAFDGDADRCVCVLPDGTSLSGDNVLVAIARYYKYSAIVGTIYSNRAVKQVLNQENITFLTSDVGDQAVKKLMNKQNCLFGGERSGHFIFADVFPTGDGLLSALKIANIKDFENLQQFEKMPSKTFNINAKNKAKLSQKLLELKPEFDMLLNQQGRVMIRPSGTEQLVRVLIEHPSNKTIKNIEKLINLKIKQF